MNPIVKQVAPHATKLIRSDHTFVLSQFHKLDPTMPPATRAAVVRNICGALEIHAQLEEDIFYPALRACGLDSAALSRSADEHAEMRRLIERVRATERDSAQAGPRITDGRRTRLWAGSGRVDSSSGQPAGDPMNPGMPEAARTDDPNVEGGEDGIHEELVMSEHMRHKNDPNEALHALMNAVLHHMADEETEVLPAAERLLGKRRLAELGAEMTARRLQWARPHAAELALDRARAAPGTAALVTMGALVAGSLLVSGLRRVRQHGGH